jgi:branched-chain amino acid transport system permease protein
LGTEAPTWRYVLYPISLLLLMLLRPQGLLGGVEWGFLKRPVIRPRAVTSPQVAAAAPAGE